MSPRARVVLPVPRSLEGREGREGRGVITGRSRDQNILPVPWSVRGREGGRRKEGRETYPYKSTVCPAANPASHKPSPNLSIPSDEMMVEV